LERRPDVAGAERQVQVASAQIGVAKSAFFPSFSLTGSTTSEGVGLSRLLSMPTLLWSVGPEVVFNIANLAAYQATVAAASENYNASVATYRQTVLAAFQDVEDNLAALKVLEEQTHIQEVATNKAKKSLDIASNQYSAGIIDYNSILQQKIAYYNAAKSLNDIKGLKTTTTIALIKSLGGGWE
jgi:outer membrane protein TolC